MRDNARDDARDATTASSLLAEPRRARLRAVRDIALSQDMAFALRRVLYTDRDAEVRAAAARRLGGVELPAAEGWLLAALGDSSPLVRDAVIRALAKRGTGAALPALRTSAYADRMWWVRRAAIYALAAIGGAAELPAFKAALGDPFWRVRHAAVKVLAVLGARDLEVRGDVIASPPSPALAFLRAAWGPAAVDAPGRAQAPSALPAALLDPDPAVVTARLVTAEVSAVALVELLCDPHAPLRLLAAQRIAASGDRAAYEAALDWLEEPRIPHVADTVERLLDGLGDPAADVARHALARPARTGGARWAIGWIAATRFTELYDAALELARTHAALRRPALPLATNADLLAWVTPELVDPIAIELHERRAFESLATLDATSHPQARTLQLDAAARLERWTEVEAALGDPHHGPRAIATRWLVRAERIDGLAQAGDPDPAVREAAVTPETAPRLAGDPDPFVCRAAIQALAARWHGRDALPDEVTGAVHAAHGSRDPWIRAEACRFPLIDDRALAAVLAALADGDEMVRSAAQDALAHGRAIDERVRAILPSLPDRTMAYAWLCRHLDDEAGALARAALDGEDTERARAMLRAMLRAIAGTEVEEAGSNAEAGSDAEAEIDAGSDAEAGSNAGSDAEAGIDAGSDAEAEIDAGSDAEAEIDAGSDAEAGSNAGSDAGSNAGSDAPAHEDSPAPRVSIEPSIEPSREPSRPAAPQRRFARAGFDAAPLAISGAFDLSASALAAAADAGVDLWFWEPAYHALTRFLRTRRRHRMRVIAGSYHADAGAIEADVDRALRRLRRDTLDVFLLFWSRSAARIDAGAFEMLARIQRTGKVRAIGFSTHDRALARTAIEASPWDVVMTRHSAAHPGIETELLPMARAREVSVITFSALCYGRMLSGPGAPSPADCYRYSLSQPGVTACISAPRRYRELVENLEVLAAPTLAEGQLAALREHGVGVRAESQRFNTLMRQPTRDAAAAAREMLAAELPPADEIEPRRLPRAGAARRARTSLGKARRR